MKTSLYLTRKLHNFETLLESSTHRDKVVRKCSVQNYKYVAYPLIRVWKHGRRWHNCFFCRDQPLPPVVSAVTDALSRVVVYATFVAPSFFLSSFSWARTKQNHPVSLVFWFVSWCRCPPFYLWWWKRTSATRYFPKSRRVPRSFKLSVRRHCLSLIVVVSLRHAPRTRKVDDTTVHNSHHQSTGLSMFIVIVRVLPGCPGRT